MRRARAGSKRRGATSFECCRLNEDTRFACTTLHALPHGRHPMLDSRIMRLRGFFPLPFFVLRVVLLCQWQVAAQESKPLPPPTPATPGTLQDSLESLPVPARPEIATLQDLASRLLHHAEKAGCHKGDCTIFVMSFVFPDGHTSRYSMHLADELSSEMTGQQKSVRMIDRTLLQDVLERERISAHLQNEEPVARWLGKRLNATAVLVGTTNRVEKDSLQLSAHLLSVTDAKQHGPSAEVSFFANEETADLTPTDGLPALPPITATSNGEKVHKVNRGNGVSPPSCSYMPSPPYTDEARKAKFSGLILAEGIVYTDGAVREPRIIEGAPYGLNETALNSMATWK